MHIQTSDGMQAEHSPASVTHPASTHCLPGHGEDTILARPPEISTARGPSLPSTVNVVSLPRSNEDSPKGEWIVSLEASPARPRASRTVSAARKA